MTPKKHSLLETDLYRPLADYLAAQGYTVRGEVKDCDLVATRGDQLVVVELKCKFSTQLLVQAARRQRAADCVYVAVPRPKARQRCQWRGIAHLLRRLELGLIWVSTGARRAPVEVQFHPLPFERRRSHRARCAIITEAAARPADYNVGGSTRRRIVTSYRREAIFVAECLAEKGPLSPRELRALGTGPRTLSILSSNFYGWFERVERGVYRLKAEGLRGLAEYPAVAEECSKCLEAAARHAPPAAVRPAAAPPARAVSSVA